MTAASVVQCSPLPSFQGRRNSSLCVSDFPHVLMELSSVSAPGGPRPRDGGGGAPAWFSYHPSRGWAKVGSAFIPLPGLLELGTSRELQLSVDLLLLVFSRALEFVLVSGSFVSPDSAPPPPGYRRNVLRGEQKALECGQDPVCRGGRRPSLPTWAPPAFPAALNKKRIYIKKT